MGSLVSSELLETRNVKTTTISSEAPQGERSETIPFGSRDQVIPKRSTPLDAGEDMVPSSAKVEAVRNDGQDVTSLVEDIGYPTAAVQLRCDHAEQVQIGLRCRPITQ